MKLWIQFVAWLKSKNITSHTIAAAGLFAFTLYCENDEVREYVNALLVDGLHNHPKMLGGVMLAISVACKYSHSSKPTARAQGAENGQTA